jgi:heme/copper-type cytochrome/quinol oxidase subunit 4
MSIDAIGVFVYIVVLRIQAVYDLSIKRTAIMIGFGPLVMLTAIRFITAVALSQPVNQLITPASVFIAIVQLVASFFILHKLQQADDNDLTSWFIIAALGAIVNYALIPYIVPLLIVF